MNPNVAIAKSAAAVDSNATEPTGFCLHCKTRLCGAARFCCAGCEKVYQFLATENLSKYYELLAGLEARAPTQTEGPGESPGAPMLDLFRVEGEADEYAFFTPSLSCAACLWLVQRAFRAQGADLAAVVGVRVNLEDKLVLVRVHPGAEAPLAAILRRLSLLGYRAYPPRLGQSEAFQADLLRGRLVDLGIAGAVFGNVMLFAAAVYFGERWGMPRNFERFFNLFSLGLATLSLCTAGRSFFVNAGRAVRGGKLHIDTPIAAALVLAFGVSVAHIVGGAGSLYFDSVTGLIFLLLVGRYLNDVMQARASRLAGSAVALLPEGGKNLRPGDVATVRPGDVVPADGVVISGASEVSEAAITGEQAPRAKAVGDPLFAGTHNLVGAVVMRVTRSGEESYLMGVAKLAGDAAQSRAPFATAAERWLRWFLGGVCAAAALAAAVWLRSDPARVVEVVCATLIVSCPCALALATPLTMAAALRRAWAHGVIVKSGEALERAALIDDVVVDKTGTLTTGHMSVTGRAVASGSRTAGAILRTCAELSRHPVARSVASFLHREGGDAGVAVVVTRSEDVAGGGLVAEGHGVGPNGRTIFTFKARLGSAKFARAAAPDDETIASLEADGASGTQRAVGVVWTWSVDGRETARRYIDVFELTDRLRDDATQIVRQWQTSGLRVFIVSGDTPGVVARVAAACGIPPERAVAEALPADKRAFVRALAAEGRRVMMVGDGVNDAAALAEADVGVAVSGGVDLALAAADVFLSRDGLAPVAQLLAYARHTTASLRLVLAFSALYNVVAVGLAISGFMHPLVAALIMPASSLTVILLGTLRNGEHLWKSYSSSCPLPSPSPAGHS